MTLPSCLCGIRPGVSRLDFFLRLQSGVPRHRHFFAGAEVLGPPAASLGRLATPAISQRMRRTEARLLRMLTVPPHDSPKDFPAFFFLGSEFPTKMSSIFQRSASVLTEIFLDSSFYLLPVKKKCEFGNQFKVSKIHMTPE